MRRSLVIAETVKRQHTSKKELVVHKRKVKGFCLFMVLVICLSLIYVWTRIQVVQFGYDVSSLRKEIKDLDEQKNLLVDEVARLKSPDRLEKKARTDLKMRLPYGGEIVFVEP